MAHTFWSCRTFLKTLAQGALLSGAFNLADAVYANDMQAPFPDSAELEADKVFPQGIASGDPRTDGVLLWTRVPGEAAAEVAWQIAEDEAFAKIIGDYIYEYECFPMLQVPLPGREIKLPDALVIDEKNGVVAAHTLEDYREIYRVTRTDRDLRRIHQLSPFVIIWDDHEITNDAWQDHAADFNGLRGDEKDTPRREAATRAWFEHLPVDVPFTPEAGYPNDIVTWRKFQWGRHAELFLTDQRYYRSDHVIPEGPVDISIGKILPNSPVGSRAFCMKSPI